MSEPDEDLEEANRMFNHVHEENRREAEAETGEAPKPSKQEHRAQWEETQKNGEQPHGSTRNNSSDQDASWPEPQPLEEYLKPVEQPPLDKMPEIVSEWITDSAHHRRCAPDFTAVTALAMFSSVVGTRFRICVNHENHEWEEAPNLYGGIIGVPGSKKTPAMKAVLSQLERLMIEESSKFSETIKKFDIEEADRLQQEKALNKEITRLRAQALQNIADDKKKKIEERLENLKQQLEDMLMNKPEPPSERVYLLNDTTTAALLDALSKDPNCIFFFRDELTGMLVQMEMKNFEDLRKILLEGHDGKQSFKGIRIGRGEYRVRCLCLAPLGGIQPAVFVQYLRDPKTDLSADGMLYRFQLLVYPDIPKHRRHVDESANVEAKNRCFYILKQMATADVCKGFGAHPPDEYNQVPWFIYSLEAKKLWEDWLFENEKKVLDKNTPNMIQQHLSKYPKLFHALAGIFHVIELADNGQKGMEIPKRCAEWAAAWCAYLESHIWRIHDMVNTPSMAAATILAGKLIDPDLKEPLEDGVRARDIQTRRWKGLETTELIADALARLVELSWIRRIKINPPTGPSTYEYLVNPAILKCHHERPE